MVGVLEAKTDRRGDWNIENIADGAWVLSFEKDGYVTAEAHSNIDAGQAVRAGHAEEGVQSETPS